MTNNKICTESELKNFAWNTKPTVFNLARWLESKTNDKYTIVEKQLIRDMLLAFDEGGVSANNVESLKKKWQDVIAMMML